LIFNSLLEPLINNALLNLKMIMKKDVVVGLGEIGLSILKLISKKETVVGYDLNKKLINKKYNN